MKFYNPIQPTLSEIKILWLALVVFFLISIFTLQEKKTEKPGLSKLTLQPYLSDTIFVNTATAQAFDQLPGIGEKTAWEIVENRNLRNCFESEFEFRYVNRRINRIFPNIKNFLIFDSCLKANQNFIGLKTKIDLNVCNAQELVVAKITTQAAAERIIKKRDKIKLFKSHNDLLNIDGVDLTFHRIKENTVIKPKIIEKININTCTIQELIDLPFIGAKMADKIIKTREFLGGFTDLDRLMLVEGVYPALLEKWKPYLKAQNASIKKIKINQLSAEELKKAPKLGKEKIVNNILAYRSRFGRFPSIGEVHNIKGLSDKNIYLLTPYLSFE